MDVQVNPYLSFNGQCEAAFKFYAQCFGVPVPEFFRFAGSPMADQAPPAWQNKVMHSTLVIGGSSIMGADPPPDDFKPPTGFSMSVVLHNIEEAERIFKALSIGGTVQMPLQETFWAARFGMLVDQFGIPWMVNCGAPR
jgi:PhnB protein